MMIIPVNCIVPVVRSLLQIPPLKINIAGGINDKVFAVLP